MSEKVYWDTELSEKELEHAKFFQDQIMDSKLWKDDRLTPSDLLQIFRKTYKQMKTGSYTQKDMFQKLMRSWKLWNGFVFREDMEQALDAITSFKKHKKDEQFPKREKRKAEEQLDKPDVLKSKSEKDHMNVSESSSSSLSR
jgi:hypothetical protein